MASYNAIYDMSANNEDTIKIEYQCFEFSRNQHLYNRLFPSFNISLKPILPQINCFFKYILFVFENLLSIILS